MTERSIATITTEAFALLEPLGPEDRERVMKAVFALLGQALPSTSAASPQQQSPSSSRQDSDGLQLGPKARGWTQRHNLTKQDLETVFYFNDGTVALHATETPGGTRKEKTINCYLLEGARSYLETDIPKIDESAVITFCKHTDAYDRNNHTSNRSAVGNRMSGTRADGFELTGPGLKSAGDLLSELARSARKAM